MSRRVDEPTPLGRAGGWMLRFAWIAWYYIFAILFLILLLVPMFFTHEVAHGIAAMFGRDEDERAMIYLGGDEHSVRRPIWKLTFALGLPDSILLHPCCWWDWRRHSVTRKRLAILAGPLSDASWFAGLFVATVYTGGWLRIYLGLCAVLAFTLLLSNLLPVAIGELRTDGWHLTHLRQATEHPPCRPENALPTQPD